ncbi:hypothetical protein [Streptomyces sp. NBC_01445]|uniref:hypothetical protein n=1 Tax=Streptomyces sp. NBC_01445 TaxID=2903869 RepID=UPI002DD9E60B|nr:hypothetical protein [Streptomyces sp. NBC_01445]WSE02112.1 hypothetical protein OG574_00925 [Streptomyces sp. NBC_01445]
MPLPTVELTGSRQVEHPLVVPGAAYRPLVLARCLQAEDVSQQPLLRRPEVVPPQPLYLHAHAEVFALHDRNTRLAGECAAGIDMAFGCRKGLGFAGA